MPFHLAAGYKSRSQQARVVTESWAASHLYCPNCDSSSLKGTPNNEKAKDFDCPKCPSTFQLKAKSSAFGSSLSDGAYEAMMSAIRSARTPTLVAMQYRWPQWEVRDLILIPHFAISESAIIKRKPLPPEARRAGWVGCNISLNRIPQDTRIPIISNGVVHPPEMVRASYHRVKPLEKMRTALRGWALDVLRCIHQANRTVFTNDDIYAFEEELAELHPDNQNIRAKIRQQLQVLRDCGLLRHIARGQWTLTPTNFKFRRAH